MIFKAKTVHDCWLIARNATEAYQKRMHQAATRGDVAAHMRCKAARDAADRIALKIRYGTRRVRK